MRMARIIIPFLFGVAATTQLVQCAKADEPLTTTALINANTELTKCIAVVDVLRDAVDAVKNSIFGTCEKGGTFEAVDSAGVRHKFYCSEVIEL